MKDTASEARDKIVLIFGDQLALESVDDKIAALGYSSHKKAILSDAIGWINIENEIKQILVSGNLLATLIFFSKKIFFNTCKLGYFERLHILLEDLKKTPTIIFYE